MDDILGKWPCFIHAEKKVVKNGGDGVDMARIPIVWEELPEEIQNRLTSKTLRELFISEGGQFYRAEHKKDGVRYYAGFDKNTAKRIDGKGHRGTIDGPILDMIRLHESILLRDPLNWGPHANTPAGIESERFANEFIDKLIASCPELSRDDFKVIWLKDGETAYLSTPLLSKEFRVLTSSTAEKTQKSIAHSLLAIEKVKNSLLAKLGNAKLAELFTKTFEENQKKRKTDQYEFVRLKTVSKAGYTVNDIFGNFLAYATLVFEDDRTISLVSTAFGDTADGFEKRVQAAIAAINFRPCFETATVIPGSVMAAFAASFSKPKSATAVKENVEVTVSDLVPKLLNGQYLIRVRKNDQYTLLTENGKGIRFALSDNGYERAFDEKAPAIDFEDVAEKAVTALSETKVAKGYPYQYHVELSCGNTAADIISISAQEENHTKLEIHDAVIRHWGTELALEQIVRDTAETFESLTGDELFQQALVEGTAQCHFSGSSNLLKRELLECIISMPTATKEGFVKRDVLAKFTNKVEHGFIQTRIAEVLDDLLGDSVVDDRSTAAFCFFQYRQVKARKYSYYIYFLDDKELAKSVLRSMKGRPIAYDDLEDIKVASRPSYFQEIAERAQTPEEAFEVVYHLDLLSKKDGTPFIQSNIFSKVLALLTPEDKLFAAVTVRDYPGCAKIAEQLESEFANVE